MIPDDYVEDYQEMYEYFQYGVEKMRTLHFCAFEPLHNQEPRPVTIIINNKLPTFENFGHYDALDAANDFYEKEARVLMNALHDALPQGTFDRLGIEFMKKKVSLYRGKTDE